VSRDGVITAARDAVAAGQPLDMQALAETLGVGRRTLYRWFGDREGLLGEVLWRMTSDGMERVARLAGGSGTQRMLEAIELYIRRAVEYQPFLAVLAAEPQLTVRLLMMPDGPVQPRLVAALTELARREQANGWTPPMDLEATVFLLVQLVMSYLWATAIVGEPPDADHALRMARALVLGGAGAA